MQALAIKPNLGTVRLNQVNFDWLGLGEGRGYKAVLIRACRPITTEADAVESVMLCLVHRYSILAPNAIPQGFVDGKQVTDKILSALQLDPAEYRLGTTKVFFKAGVLGMLEDMRDERLSKIIAMFQAYIRGYLMRKAYKKLQDQR